MTLARAARRVATTAMTEAATAGAVNIEPVLEQVVEWRRHLHRHPELSFQERETGEFVARTLEGFGDALEVDRPAGHSVVARLRTGRPGPVVALRADIDALPIDEQSGVDFASENPGAMHACGHDAHTAMLLGAARALAEARDRLPGGELRFLFQAAEELAPGGARDLVAAGAVDGVDFVYGCHVWSELEYGKVAAMPGPFMAAADFFTLAITGRGGHGGLPHLADDVVVIGAQVVTNLQHVVARRVDPLERAVLSVGAFHAGDAPNVIPGRAELAGTVRTFAAEVRERMPVLIEDILRGVTSAHGAEYELDYQFGYEPVVNDERATALVREAIGAGELADIAPIMGGDDFSAYLARAPGCYAFIGARDEASGAVFPHHHPRFRLDERALATGVRLHTDVALRALKEVQR
jgi:amidohydrolase